jgi:competence protein ComEC
LHNLKHNCCGDSLVYIKGKKDLVYGEELILIGDLRRPFSYKDKRKNSWRNYLNNQNIYSILWVKNISQAIRLNRKKTFMLKGFSLRLKEKMERIIFKYLPGVPASVLDAMVLGEKRNIPPFISDTMMKAGTVHILVVSGFNVGIVIFAISLFLKLIRIPRRGRFAITIPLLIIYCLMTGASNPVVRATVMGIIFMLAHWLQREPDIYNSSAIAALFILLYNPRQLFDVGFQLSFASVLSIVYFYPKIKSFLRINSLKIKYLRYIIEGCLISFSAWLGTMGFIAYYFKIFSPITVLANVFIVPLASLITLCGFGLIILGLTWPLPAFLFAKATEFLVVVLLYLNTFLIKLPGAYLYLS